jgi:hypothetical protein
MKLSLLLAVREAAQNKQVSIVGDEESAVVEFRCREEASKFARTAGRYLAMTHDIGVDIEQVGHLVTVKG